MNNTLTKKEREHLGVIKAMPCAVCGTEGGSEAHHIEQHRAYTCIPLCESCHRSSFNGIHGQARIWKVMKKTELSCLNDTIRKLVGH